MKRMKANLIIILIVMTVVMTSFLSIKVKADNGVDEFVNRCYTISFQREPDEEGFGYWKKEIESKKRTGTDVVYNFIFSDEYENQKTSDEQYIKDLYAMFMGREPDQEGYEYWYKELTNGKTRKDIFLCFANSPEFYDICSRYSIVAGYYSNEIPADRLNQLNLFVGRMYENVFDRLGDPEGQKYWVEVFASGKLTGIRCAELFIKSAEFEKYELSQGEYIDKCYKVFMSRKPDETGKEYWLELLKSGAISRDQVFESFANSEEFAEICKSYGIESGEYKANVKDDNHKYDDDPSKNPNEYYEDGKIKKEKIFDENGKLTQTREYDTNGKLTQTKNYDENEKLIQAKEYDENEKLIKVKEYDENEKLIQAKEYDENEKLIQSKEYDSNGKLTKETKYNQDEEVSDEKKYEYDELGNIKTITTYEYDESGKLKVLKIFDGSEILISKRENEYFDNGFLREETFYDSEGVMIKKNYFSEKTGKVNHIEEYENKLLVKETQYDNSGNCILRIDEYEYNSDNKLIIDKHKDCFGNTVFVHSYEYDDGSYTVTVRDGEGKLTRKTQYDDKEREIKTVSYDGDGNVEYTREIEYDENGYMVQKKVTKSQIVTQHLYTYYDNGNTSAENIYVNNVLDKQIEYYGNGKIHYNRNYSKGKLRKISEYNEDGTLYRTIYFGPDGGFHKVVYA